MRRRAYVIFSLLILLSCAAVYSVANVSGGAEYVAAAEGQALYKLDVAHTRGIIYDCNLQPLTNTEKQLIAAVAPTIESIGALEKATEGKYRNRLAAALEDGKPFIMELQREIDDPQVDFFSVPQRYSENQPAPHIIGYLDSMGAGVSGVELAMNDLLEEYSGSAEIYYQIDALGRVVAGGERQIINTLSESRGGVALTIDRDIQALAEGCGKALRQGAVVITEVPSCEIRAIVSFPSFTQTDLEAAANSQNGALINRAFCAYAPGSVFKLVSAAAILETGESPAEYTCTGSVNSDGLLFHCINSTAHGKLDLKGALENSCNCYFINSAKALGGQKILSTAYNLGLGVEQEFGRGLFSQSGNLPTAVSLENSRALANFAFGQGELTVTPLQMCGMMNTIASGGVYSSPKLISGTVNEDLELTPVKPISDKAVRVMSVHSALKLESYMISTAVNGTAADAAPVGVTVGIKTGTAQTGIFDGEDELLHFWYCGFVCDNSGARYCISALREATAYDNGTTARVFREIAEGLADLADKQT